MRPTVQFLSENLRDKIIDEGRELLCKLGVEIRNDNVISLLCDHGAKVENGRLLFTQDMIDQALKTVPSSFKLYDVNSELAEDIGGYNVHFTPGSAAINYLDPVSGELRTPNTSDFIRYTKVVSGLKHITSQSTCMIPNDVTENISDSYRLYLCLLHGTKPVVTGAFTIKGFDVLRDLQVAVRGSKEALAEKPLCILSCCPTSPLKWSDVTPQNVVDCAQHGIPVEFISMPLSGFMAPVSLSGTLVGHTAETLSGVVISQCARAGAPVLYGGSPAIFDVRYETTPMGAIGTMMIDSGFNQIGKHLGIPTQAYTGFSDSKALDAQAGLETGMGATLAALSGINHISGPGMIDFESAFSIEKLTVDNEIAGMTQRMVQGIEEKETFPCLPHFEELLKEGHLLISDHTRKYLREEIYFPSEVINRANKARWLEEGKSTMHERAVAEADRLVAEWQKPELPMETINGLTEIMQAAAQSEGMDKLPALK